MMERAKIERVYLPTETLGSWYFRDQMVCKTMELPKTFEGKENVVNKTCIPETTETFVYICKKEAYTEHHPYPHFRLMNVKGRIGILVHLITFVKDLLGCIGVGSSFVDFNKDGVPDIAGSTLALNKLYALMPDEFELEIKTKPSTL